MVMMNKGLRIPNIGFDLPITDLIIELEKLRYKELRGTTHPLVFLQLRQLFQMLESIGSSRIEGNNTTVLDYVESAKLNTEPVVQTHEQILEIINIEEAMKYLEDNIMDMPISIHMIRELHSIVVRGLSAQHEGAANPGAFRTHDVHISGSKHVPPIFADVECYMQELMDFVNRDDSPKYDLLKIAIAHHRFVWIHPFENGNGRVVRLFTYALLLKYVFKSSDRIINPTAVFCSDRQAYYDNLAKADTGTDNGLLEWAQYMLEGLKSEIVKIDQLCDYANLSSRILMPSLQDAVLKHYITPEQALVLKTTINKEDQILQSKDLEEVFPTKSSSDRSRLISGMKDCGLLIPIEKNARRYVVCFSNNYWMRSILSSLDKNGFLPQNNRYLNEL